MTVWRLRVPDPLAAMVRRLHPDLKRKVRAALTAISRDPHAGMPLREGLDRLHSFRVGRLRIVFQLAAEARTVDIVTIGPRTSIYEETYRRVGHDARE